jgi:hypothetical protein
MQGPTGFEIALNVRGAAGDKSIERVVAGGSCRTPRSPA